MECFCCGFVCNYVIVDTFRSISFDFHIISVKNHVFAGCAVGERV